jgi:ribosomal-protein-alanine N-acetyltransferase
MVLETDRLRLVACSVELAVALVADTRDLATGLLRAELPPDWPPPDLISLLRGYAEAVARDPALVGWGPWVVVENDRVVGSVGFHGTPVDGSVELGYGIVAAASGRGIATEATAALVEWARGDERVRQIVAEVQRENAASKRVLTKVGLRYTDAHGGNEVWRYYW